MLLNTFVDNGKVLYLRNGWSYDPYYDDDYVYLYFNGNYMGYILKHETSKKLTWNRMTRAINEYYL